MTALSEEKGMERASKHQRGERTMNSGSRRWPLGEIPSLFPLPQVLNVINPFFFFRASLNLCRLEQHLPQPHQAAQHFLFIFLNF